MSQRITQKKILAIVSFGLFVAGVGYYFYPKEAPLSFATEPAQRGNIESTVLATGMLQASKLVAVGAQVSGRSKNWQWHLVMKSNKAIWLPR